MALINSGLVSIFAQNIGASVQFYGEILGLQQTYRFPREGEPEHVEFSAGTMTLAVSSSEGLASHGMPDPTPGHSFQLGFNTDDVDVLVELLRSKGVEILLKPFDSPAGNRVAYFSDPDGTWISVYHRLKKSE